MKEGEDVDGLPVTSLGGRGECCGIRSRVLGCSVVRPWPAALLAFLCVALLSCGSYESGKNPELEADFIESLDAVVRQQGDISRFDLAEVTTFDWTFVHVFRPYTPETVVHMRVGSVIDSRSIDWRDDINLLVFTGDGTTEGYRRDNGVVLSVAVPRGVCDFQVSVGNVKGGHVRVAADNAHFQVVMEDDWCRASPVHAMRD